MLRIFLATAAAILLLGGCSDFIAETGPNAINIKVLPGTLVASHGIELVKVDYPTAHAIALRERPPHFSSFAAGAGPASPVVGSGDVLTVAIWKASPATLFASGGAPEVVNLPAQMVDNAGDVAEPFVGTLHVAGRTVQQIEQDIAERLAGAPRPFQVLVARTINNTRNATVVGNVAHSMEVPLNPGGVRLLRAIALAGGVTKPVEQVSIQLSRGGRVMVMPFEDILRDPNQNIPLRAGDVVAAISRPWRFIVLGATGGNREIEFQTSGISLAQAIARAGGIDDNRGNPSAVFVFRFSDPEGLPSDLRGVPPVDGKVPTIFEFDLRDPAVLFAAETFPMRDHDLLYVSDAPSADLQKVFNLIGSIVFPYQAYVAAGGTMP